MGCFGRKVKYRAYSLLGSAPGIVGVTGDGSLYIVKPGSYYPSDFELKNSMLPFIFRGAGDSLHLPLGGRNRALSREDARTRGLHHGDARSDDLPRDDARTRGLRRGGRI